MIMLILLGLLSIWIFTSYAYIILPNIIPTHFEMNGKPNEYGNKSSLFILALALSIGPIIFLLVTKYRFTLINKYPYLLNLPAFFVYLTKLKNKKRSIWFNKYFEILLCFGAALTFSLLLMDVGIIIGEINERVSIWFMLSSITLVLLPIIPFLLYLRKLSIEVGIKK